ncbi:antirestriction protein [Paraburkholderia flagellata]|uniref:antirestriction protein n=1 Tax=Paraburkholderia flagellata TaxID=2883241 RepID=UPI001F1A2F7B|nr:antirestriction protein [Paraburkholderia flagellata]
MIEATNPVTASPVPEDRRLSFLPKHLGARLITGEALVYRWASVLSDYDGGVWEFLELSNGGFYLAPRTTKRFAITCNLNGFTGEVTADAAGIIFTLYMLNQLANQTQEDSLINEYYLLRDFATTHREYAAIFGAID